MNILYIYSRCNIIFFADTALKNIFSGYLTRRLCDVAQDLTNKIKCDCKKPGFIELSEILEGGNVVVSFLKGLLIRITFDDVKHPITGEIFIKKLTMIMRQNVIKLMLQV